MRRRRWVQSHLHFRYEGRRLAYYLPRFKEKIRPGRRGSEEVAECVPNAVEHKLAHIAEKLLVDFHRRLHRVGMGEDVQDAYASVSEISVCGSLLWREGRDTTECCACGFFAPGCHFDRVPCGSRLRRGKCVSYHPHSEGRRSHPVVVWLPCGCSPRFSLSCSGSPGPQRWSCRPTQRAPHQGR